jgi:multiple sugar transport system substrate-binding protein
MLLEARKTAYFRSALALLTLCGGLTLTTSCQAPPTVANTSPNTDASNATPSDDSIAELPQLKGTTIRILTGIQPQISEPLERRAAEFEALTGAKVELTITTMDQFYDLIKADLGRATPQYDVVVFGSQWLVDFAQANYLENLTERVKVDTDLQWDDVALFFRDFSTSYGDQIYAIPLDGDFQMVYYRTDLLDQAGLEAPKTWQDYLEVAKVFHDKDLNGDGEADYGSCIAKKSQNQSHYMFWSIVSPFLQSQGTKQGAFFNTDTMKPLVNNEAFATALELYKATGTYGAPNELEMVVEDTRNLFVDGRCALTIDWGDIGTLAIAPNSKVVDRVSAVILPGTTQVLDRATGQLVNCDKFSCPYAIDGINHAPYAAFGGWVGSISAKSEPTVKDGAYAFLSYMSQPAQANEDVTIGITGFNPYRISQFTERERWLEAGMSSEATQKYLGGISVSLNSPNMVLDLRVPQNQQYQLEVMDIAIADFLQGKSTLAEAMKQIETEWEKVTTELGRASQKAAYRSSLGLEP